MQKLDHIVHEIRRACMELEMQHPGARSLMLTSPAVGEGTTTVTSLYGKVLSGMNGSTVCVVDANMHSPGLHRRFAIGMEKGLRDWEPDADGTTIHMVDDSRQLSVMPAGTSNGRSLYSLQHSGRLERLSAQLKKNFNFVLWDTPPLTMFPEGRFLLPHVDGVLVVVEADGSQLEALTELHSQLVSSNAPVLGVIMNRSGRYSFGTRSTSGRALRLAS